MLTELSRLSGFHCIKKVNNYVTMPKFGKFP